MDSFRARPPLTSSTRLKAQAGRGAKHSSHKRLLVKTETAIISLKQKAETEEQINIFLATELHTGYTKTLLQIKRSYSPGSYPTHSSLSSSVTRYLLLPKHSGGGRRRSIRASSSTTPSTPPSQSAWRKGGGGEGGTFPPLGKSFPPLSPPPFLRALCEGGVAGVVEELALIERRLPPPECLGNRRW